MSKIDGMHNSSTYKKIFWALSKVIMNFALHTLHNQHRSISDHIYNVDDTHDNRVSGRSGWLSRFVRVDQASRRPGRQTLVLFDIPHLINTCININIYMTICILINFTQSPLTLSSSRVSFPYFSPCSLTFFPLQISTNKLFTMKDILYINFGSYVTYCNLGVK